MKIFGREPTVWLALIGTVLTAVAGLNVTFMSPGAAAAIVAALTAVTTALFTRPVAPSLYTAAIVAVVAVGTTYGFDVADNVQTGLIAVTLAVFSFFGIRPQVTPRSDPQPVPTVVL